MNHQNKSTHSVGSVLHLDMLKWFSGQPENALPAAKRPLTSQTLNHADLLIIWAKSIIHSYIHKTTIMYSDIWHRNTAFGSPDIRVGLAN